MKKTLWMLLDDRRGSTAQAEGIADALAGRIEIENKRLVYTKAAALPNWIRGRTLLGIDEAMSDSLLPPYPDVILSTSRRTVPVARYIRQRSGNQSKIVQLMYPDGGVGIRDMALVAVPAHDDIKKQTNPKSLVITGAPTRIFADRLAEWKMVWQPKFKDLPQPLTAVIVGGAIKGKPWPLDNAEDLAAELRKLHNLTGGSFLLTTSRRTGKKAQEVLLRQLTGIPMYTYLWGEQKENPLFGFYACADRIVVTADSVSMCSEACGTGAPVLLYKGHNWLSPKHLRFADSLINKGFALDIKDSKALAFRPKGTLNSAAVIADKILEIA